MLPADYEFEFRGVGRGDSDEQLTLRLDSLLGIRFSKLPALHQLKVIQNAITKFQTDDFAMREQALRTLVTGTEGFRPLIEELFGGIADPESRWRLAAALEAIPSQHGIYEHAYDEITLPDQITKGDLNEWKIAAQYRGADIELDRRNVHAMRAMQQSPASGGRRDTRIIATTEPIRKDLDVLFPDDSIRIDFEFDSKGDALRPGQDVSRRFIPDGVIIGTSVEDSFFSVNDHEVSSRSRGQSGATHQPLFHGTITLRFCVPGDENEPAGVTHVGLYAAVVLEGGTSLAAYDAYGHRIATVLTETGSHQFLGLRSNVLIHRVEIIPDKTIDPDVTIDDLVFSVPEPLDAGGVGYGYARDGIEPEAGYSLDFSGGERLACTSFRLSGGKILARPAGGFASEIAFPVEQLVRIQTGVTDQPPAELEDGGVRFWTMLQDGSTLLARDAGEGEMPKTLLHQLPLDSLPLTALWSETRELSPFPADLDLHDSEIVTIATTTPATLTAPVLTSKKFTATKHDSTVEYSYNRLPTIWLRKPDPATRDKASGFIRLKTSERLVLSDTSTFRLGGFDSKSLRVTRGEQTFQIPLDSITSLLLPKQK
jgi:hypothetical protein